VSVCFRLSRVAQYHTRCNCHSTSTSPTFSGTILTTLGLCTTSGRSWPLKQPRPLQLQSFELGSTAVTASCFGLVKNVDRQQWLKNNLARVVLQAVMSASSTDLRHKLHWLPVKHRVIFNLATLSFKPIQFGKPEYLCDLLHEYQPARTLRSSSAHLLHQPFTSISLASRSLFVAAALQRYKSRVKTKLNSVA